jgi:ABC-type branched-subunit amino acid transport system substrate-binding protein
LKHRSTRVVRVVSGALVAGLALAGIATTGAGAQAANEPGVSAKGVKLGFIFSETGPAGSTFKNSGKACQARIDRENANGGVNGREIDMELVDDGATGNLPATQDLVQNRDVFAIVNNSSFAVASYRYMLEQGVPMIGGGFDGTYYTQKENADIISALGSGTPFPALSYTTTPKVMKQLGAKKTAALAYGASASSSASAKTLQDYAVPAVGLDPVYTNTTVEFGTSDVTPLVLGIKNSGADAVYLPMVAATNIAVIQGLIQNGVEMKANILATGYGQEFLDSPVADTLEPNTVLFQTYKPVELKNKSTKQFQADLEKYAGLTGVPDYGQYTGYITCNLAILGLQNAGKTPTRRAFIDGLRDLGSHDGGGLTCAPVDISLEHIGTAPTTSCSYFMYVKDGKFVVMNKSKPYTGKLVGSKEALAANQAGDLSSVTTTAAPAP